MPCGASPKGCILYPRLFDSHLTSPPTGGIFNMQVDEIRLHAAWCVPKGAHPISTVSFLPDPGEFVYEGAGGGHQSGSLTSVKIFRIPVRQAAIQFSSALSNAVK